MPTTEHLMSQAEYDTIVDGLLADPIILDMALAMPVGLAIGRLFVGSRIHCGAAEKMTVLYAIGVAQRGDTPPPTLPVGAVLDAVYRTAKELGITA